jgi:hypothetical protein
MISRIIENRFESRHRKDELVQHITSGAGIVVGPVWTFLYLVLYLLFRFTDSDYLFGIFKLFFILAKAHMTL